MQVVMSFFVAGAALPEIFHLSANVPKTVLCGRRDIFAALSEDDWHFARQARQIVDSHGQFAWQPQHIRRAACCVFCKSHCQGCVKW